MAKQGITTGTTPNDGTGDTLLSGAVKINSNFDEIYNYFGNGSNLSFTSVVWPSNDTGIHTTSKVGIGTTTASEQLTVSGNISVPDDKYSYYGTSNDLKIRHNTALGNEISNLNNKALYINDGNVVNTWFKVDSSGAVFSPAGITSVGAGITFKGTDGSILAKNQKIAGIITTGNLVATQDLTVAGKITGVGSITGATIHGSGAGLSNIVTSITAGAGVTVSGSTGTITISSASGGAQGYFQKNATGINTASNVGVGTTTSTSALTVSGDGKFTGIVTATTFSGNVTGNLTGTASTATAAATAYSLVGTATTATAAALAYGLAGTPNISVAVVSASSTITAAKFVGDGAGLTGVTASGTGIVIKDGGSLVGTAGTIDFATNLSVSAISGAAVTVTGATDNNPNVATLVVSGISTLTELEVNSRYGVTSGFGTFVAAAGVAYTINQFTIASNNFKSAEYTVHIERENTQQVQKVLVMQNGSAAYSSEYGIIYNPSLIASIGASVAGGVMKLEVTPETGQTGLTTYRFTRETMK